MPRALRGPYRAKSTPALMGEARQLARRGYSYRQIAAYMSERHPDLDGLTVYPAYYWVQGEVTAPGRRAQQRHDPDSYRTKKREEKRRWRARQTVIARLVARAFKRVVRRPSAEGKG